MQPTRTAATPAARRKRALVFSFLLIVVLPLLAISSYLAFIADDQYASRIGFVVRKSDNSGSQAFELLGGLTSLSAASSTDATILFEFIQSQKMVELVDKQLDLRTLYSTPAFDPVFAFDPGESIEGLERYWSRMVKVYYDSATGLLELRVMAFHPDDAQRIAEEIVRQSSVKINELSAIARDDATRYAREDLQKAVAALKLARQRMAEFRGKTRIVDPRADVQVQMGLISTLQQQLAESMIELDTLRLSTRNDDPRIGQTEQRIKVIESRIEAERGNIGSAGYDGKESFSEVVGRFEELLVEQEFAETAYVAALAAFDKAQAEGTRQSRYLATYVDPTHAEISEYPQRLGLVALAALFLGLVWSIGSLISYSIWDRR